MVKRCKHAIQEFGWSRARPSVRATWHTSLGGGFLVQPLSAPVTVHVVAGHSNEGTRYYFGLGYPF